MSTTLTNHGAPTIDTVGYVGQKYVDLDSCDIYECKAINTIATVNDDPSHPHGFVTVAYVEKRTNEYIWEKVGGAGGGDDYDLVIHYREGTVTNDTEATLVSGSAKAVCDKLKNGKIPNVVVCDRSLINNDGGRIDYWIVFSIAASYYSDDDTYRATVYIRDDNSEFLDVYSDGTVTYTYAD